MIMLSVDMIYPACKEHNVYQVQVLYCSKLYSLSVTYNTKIHESGDFQENMYVHKYMLHTV